MIEKWKLLSRWLKLSKYTLCMFDKNTYKHTQSDRATCIEYNRRSINNANTVDLKPNDDSIPFNSIFSPFFERFPMVFWFNRIKFIAKLPIQLRFPSIFKCACMHSGWTNQISSGHRMMKLIDKNEYWTKNYKYGLIVKCWTENELWKTYRYSQMAWVNVQKTRPFCWNKVLPKATRVEL